MNKLQTIISASIALVISGSAMADDTNIEVKVGGFNTNGGQAIVSLFRKSDGFPDRPQNAFRTRVAKIDGSGTSVEFADVPKGEYAIAVIHDANRNGEADATWLGVPTEGFGTSKNHATFYGPPKYSDAKVDVHAPSEVVEIEMRY